MADGIEFRPKDLHVGYRDGDGRLVAVGGACLATVDIDGHGPLDVVGKGALIVRRDMRGRGLSSRIIDRVAELTRDLGPDCDMAFCEPKLIELYGHQGYRLIEGPIWVDQAQGPVRWPLAAMWRPIRDGAVWPSGTVRLRGLPF